MHGSRPQPLSALAALAFAAALAACSPGGGEQIPKACARQADCPTGQLCRDKACVKLPCGGLCTDEEVCLEPNCVAADGLDCANEPSRCPSTYQCTRSGECQKTCTTDSECTAPGFRSCNPNGGFCGECTFDNDCTDPQARFCDPDTARCVGCVDGRDCFVEGAAVGKYCDTSEHSCKDGCRTGSDCRAGQRCEGGSESSVGRCVECNVATQANDCLVSPKLYCQPQKLTCVECLQNSHCSSDACDLNTNRCVECLRNEQCAPGYICSQDSFSCVPGCAGGSGDDDNCPANLPACDANRGDRGVCVACLKDADCPRAQVCNLTGGAGGLPACVPGCEDSNTGLPNDARCAPEAAGQLDRRCDGSRGTYGKCVQCLSNSDCPADKVCDAGRGICRCKGLGESCQIGAECGFRVVSVIGGVETTDCGATRPFCINKIECPTFDKTVAKVCTQFGTGLPGERGNCPPGFVSEDACEGTSCGRQCVPESLKCNR